MRLFFNEITVSHENVILAFKWHLEMFRPRQQTNVECTKKPNVDKWQCTESYAGRFKRRFLTKVNAYAVHQIILKYS